ncbi:3-hydroxybutyryl-CoA dehydrogenase [Pilimelia anulata]|uniref:3-hydroxybutyryl-CoA dehydrogenase n=1 Tax=Pilimelia anulata TaxID=53371 RepID=A0A8J3B1N9_9ACTN|nr:3-hydroxybutyryl-CoA dehydrogenase [Pilimelia anulata]GGJ83565.1 3-hydroxybutyryl-CoA dehydrogenase [Pilimelia anulata]
MSRAFRTVGVIGLGTMGAGIVEVCARNGVAVVAVEVDDAALERGRATLARSTDRAVAKGKLGEADRDALHGRVTFAAGLAALADVDLVIEAVPERLDVKAPLFAELDRICRPDAVLATNTSSLSVTDIAAATGRPERVIGVHFFNPAPVMKLVEIVRTVVTEPALVDDLAAFCTGLGKVPVTIGDRAGFIANHLLFGYLNQAIGMLESGFATRDDIDAAMQHGCGLPMGPFALLDLIGLDTSYEILRTMYERGGRSRRHAPAPLLAEMVTAGLLGRKSGRGFHAYGNGRPVPPAAAAPAGEAPQRIGLVGAGPMARILGGRLAEAGRTVVTATDDLSALADVDLVIEISHADADTVRARFAELGAVCKPGTVLGAATNALPVIDCAMASGRPEDVVGLRLPAPAVRLIEVVRTVRSGEPAVAAARALGAALGGAVVECGDRAGAIVHALLMPYLNDAVKLVESGYAGPDDIDHAMTLGCGYPVGPIGFIDHVGLDRALATLRAQFAETGEPSFAPAPLLEQMVTAGRTGQRAGRGFRPHQR